MSLDAIRHYLRDLHGKLRAGQASERTHYPVLEWLLKAVDGRLLITCEPAGIPGASVDFLVRRASHTVGYVEAKDIGRDLDEAEDSEQLKRYRERFPNLILTDFLEFRWFVEGQRRAAARLGRLSAPQRLEAVEGGAEAVLALLRDFLAREAPVIARPKQLAERLARLTQELRELIARTFGGERKSGQLHAQFEAFRETLIHELTAEQFADMYAQTVTYGLFAARAQAPAQTGFSRQKAVFDLPKTNPFLRKLFGEIAGPELDETVSWLVDDLAEVIGQADFAEILCDFGRRTRQEDPVVHFYETFLAAYDPGVRQMRGVFYTPEPIVSYIVRSVDHILKTRFDKPWGLADEKVFILDPACGTGTFLYFVVRQICDELAARGQRGVFDAYVSKHLLPRLFGFELLMAPYAVSHMKLGIQLKDLGYKFAGDQRLGVYLTNTLEEAVRQSEHVFARWISEEANAAAEIKRGKPIMVVLGNPPYSGHSANRGPWIKALIEDYKKVDGKPLGERNPKWLQDDYVKFIRFGQWRIERNGEGVLAFVTNHGYLDNPTFRGMRQSLMGTFDEIHILDLHGNTKKGEVCPDGSKDENVFDIQQGVAIALFVKKAKRPKAVSVSHADLWGTRQAKYKALSEKSVVSTRWKQVRPQSPSFLFVPRDSKRESEYGKGWRLPEVFPVSSVGIVTARDGLTVHYTREEAWDSVQRFLSCSVEAARHRFRLGQDTRDWKVALAQQDLKQSGPVRDRLVPLLYRPFDIRYTYYTGRSRGFHCMPRQEVMRHMLAGPNLAMLATRQTRDQWDILATNAIAGHKSMAAYDINTLFPLYLYADGRMPETLFDHDNGRRPNLARAFIKEMAEGLKMKFLADGAGDLKRTFGPEDVFHYAYAVFYSPAYRARYAEFLKTDFPRLPLPSDARRFRALARLGAQLAAIHLLESPKLGDYITQYPVRGDHLVDKGYPKYKTPDEVAALTRGQCQVGRVHINRSQYFEGIAPEVWAFHVGGYPVCEKWLKDRRGRHLDADDVNQYQKVVVAVAETMRLMAEIDAAIPGWPIS
jgi:predicted helicase